MKNRFNLKIQLTEAQLFQLISFTNGIVSFNRNPGVDPSDAFLQLMHILHNEAFRVAPGELYADAKRLSDKMLPVWEEPSIERGSMIGGFDGMLDKSMEQLTEEDKAIIERYAQKNEGSL